MYGFERDELEEKLADLTKKPSDSKDGSSASQAPEQADKGAGAAARTAASGKDTEAQVAELSQKKARLDENFKIISTWYDRERCAGYAALIEVYLCVSVSMCVRDSVCVPARSPRLSTTISTSG